MSDAILRKSGISTLQFNGHAYGSTIELAHQERKLCIIPGTIHLKLDGEPLHYTQVDAHGNPQISGVAEILLIWKLRQMVRDGKIESIYNAPVAYSYEATTAPIDFTIEQRLTQPGICPVCGRPIAVSDLDGTMTITKFTRPNTCVRTAYNLVDTIPGTGVVAHMPCIRTYERMKIIDEITETFDLAFGECNAGAKYQFSWGRDLSEMWYDLIPNEYCQRECCAHKPWLLFHTPIGDFKIGPCSNVISISFAKDIIASTIDDQSNKYSTHISGDQQIVHVADLDAMFDCLCEIKRRVDPNLIKNLPKLE